MSLYSPLSSVNVVEKNHPALLILFILKELIKNYYEPTPEPPATLFKWMTKGSPLQKLREHFSLLPIAFPSLASQIPSPDLPFQELVSLLEPFIMACASNENLLIFLVRYQKELAVKPLLDRICPEGLDILSEKIAASFRKRGYCTPWTYTQIT